ncbi:alpha/beta hydrolase [Sphingobacteriaceae bacterium]|nr:alpha/beta hydrolase [Sphingobacteriaceae bacterium]
MWRLIIAVILLLLSLLVLFKAPTNFFWLVQVAVTEFPWISTLTSLVFFVSCLYADKFKIALLTLSGLATFIYFLPVIEVYFRGKHLEHDLSKNFPFNQNIKHLDSPFSFTKMFSGIGIKEVQPEIFTYKKLPERELHLDFYKAALSGKRPCIIVIHGGSWAGGDSKQLPALNSYLSNVGYHVAAINYRLAPTYKSPAPVEDTKEAMQYLISHAENLNIDTTNFVLLGRSAGAQIALVAAYTFHDPNVKGVVSLYGPADMVWGARIKSNKLVLNTDKVFTDYLGALIDVLPEKYHEASSFDFAEQNSPPTLLIHGPNDALVSYYHSVRLNEKLESKHVPHYFLNLPWATHGCDYNICGPSGQISTYSIERFINSVTNQ